MKKISQIMVLLLCTFCLISCQKDSSNPTSSDQTGSNPTGSNLPSAKIQASATFGEAPLTVTFTDKSTGQVTSSLWEFSDGSSASGSSISRTYTQAGSYWTRLTVTGPGGTNSTTQNISVSAPIQKVTLSNLKCIINNTTQVVTLQVSCHFENYANQSKVVGLYWVIYNVANARFEYVKSSCNSNAPNGVLGVLMPLKPNSNDITLSTGAYFNFSCFPDRTSGKIYYAMARVYDKSESNLVTDPNSSILAQSYPSLSNNVSVKWN